MIIKGILDPQDARDAVSFGADGIVVSNHGGRQLDGVLSSARALPAIADAVKGDIRILADSGVRNGLGSPPPPARPPPEHRRRPAPVALSEEEIAAVRSWVIHEDAHVIAFSKPSGLSSQGGRIKAHTLDDLLWAFARSNGKRPELVHRLDRDTSGVILAAKTKPAAGFLGKALQMRRFRKKYLALLSAAPEPKSGTIDPAL